MLPTLPRIRSITVTYKAKMVREKNRFLQCFLESALQVLWCKMNFTSRQGRLIGKEGWECMSSTTVELRKYQSQIWGSPLDRVLGITDVDVHWIKHIHIWDVFISRTCLSVRGHDVLMSPAHGEVRKWHLQKWPLDIYHAERKSNVYLKEDAKRYNRERVSLRLHCLQTSLTQQGRLHTTKQDHLNKIAELKCVFLKTQLTKNILNCCISLWTTKVKYLVLKKAQFCIA
jgi:hypothetical protein